MPAEAANLLQLKGQNPFTDVVSPEQLAVLEQNWEEHKAFLREKPRLEAGYNGAINSWARDRHPNPQYNKMQDKDFLTSIGVIELKGRQLSLRVEPQEVVEKRQLGFITGMPQGGRKL